MRRILRWLGWTAAALVTLLLAVLVVLYGLSARVTSRTWSPAGHMVTIPTDSAAAVEGARLAQLRGCGPGGGCHGENSAGDWFLDDFLFGRLAAPNLTRTVHEYTPRQLEAVIRHGVRPDGRGVIIMPSDMFAPLTDEDLGRILAYLMQAPRREGPARHRRLGPGAWFFLGTGKAVPTPLDVQRAESLFASFPAPGDSLAAGAYLARTVCAECHGPDLGGARTDGNAPDLGIVAGYSLDAFTRLMRRGVPLDGRRLGLMGMVARERFTHFTDAEIAALHRYLQARASRGLRPYPPDSARVAAGG